ncbi:hypothetical protein FSARC_9179 [Fusarium sarcochroum]|uniref:SET domain-containing protein n=1 Tax=Fusarium sarcochroum TaxID=1208366 RepID=A0A8H4TRP1_9HYPO|nr:hypothetical protein FSARC_9179 [Fusarium sarcochroum]
MILLPRLPPGPIGRPLGSEFDGPIHRPQTCSASRIIWLPKPHQTPKPSPMERLPNEVQKIIVSNLDYQSLIFLSMVNQHFHRSVDPQQIATSADKFQFVMRAAKDFPQHRYNEKSKEHQPGNSECYMCFRVRAPEHFDVLQAATAYFDPRGRVVTDRDPEPGDREVALRRFCIGCGVENGFHAPFDCLTTKTGQSLWICRCRKLPVATKEEAMATTAIHPACFHEPMGYLCLAASGTSVATTPPDEEHACGMKTATSISPREQCDEAITWSMQIRARPDQVIYEPNLGAHYAELGKLPSGHPRPHSHHFTSFLFHPLPPSQLLQQSTPDITHRLSSLPSRVTSGHIQMENSDAYQPDEPVLTPTLGLLSLQDIPTLDLQLKGELNTSGDSPIPSVTEKSEATKYQSKDAVTIPATPNEKPLLCKNVLANDQLSASFDAIATEYGGTSGSEPDFSSDSDFWTDDDEDETTNDLVRSLTSHRGQPFTLTRTARSLLFRRPSPESLDSSVYMIPEPASLPLSPTSNADIIFQNEHFSVEQSKIAGWGAFAARKLKYGDRILVEKPLFVADGTTLFKEFDKLSEPLRELALGLHANSSCKPGTPRVKAVWTTNCFSTGTGDKAGLFPIASRFNHSCHPSENVDYCYNDIDKVLEMVVRADVINEGEELTISYGTRRTPADLFYRFGFKCRCGACGGFSEEDILGFW